MNFLLRTLAGEFMEEAGFDMYEAGNADEAIALLELHTAIRAVFTDIHMPGSMDGLKLAHDIRGRWPPVKLILTSGHEKPCSKTCLPAAVFLGSLISLKWSRVLCEQCSDKGRLRASGLTTEWLTSAGSPTVY